MIDSFVIGNYMTLYESIGSESARRYIRHGFNVRALQIKESRFRLTELIDEAGGNNINTYEICLYNILLNAYYLNILGAVDNLAWLLQHEHEIIKGATESNKKRNAIVLFGKEFQRGLSKLRDFSIEDLNEYKPWYEEIKELRDPAAHRIPLYCPPGMLSEEDIEMYKAASDIHKTKNPLSGDGEWIDSLYELSQIGKFQPVFLTMDEDGKNKVHPLKKTVEQDYEPFWRLSEFILSVLVKNVERK